MTRRSTIPEAAAGPGEATPARYGWSILTALPCLAFLGLAALFYLRLGSGDASKIPSALIGKPAPRFNLPVLTTGKPGEAAAPAATISDDALRQGHVTLVNIFASWCEPCHQEHAVLLGLSRDRALAAQGVQVIGIAYKDETANALRFMTEEGNPYAVIGIDKPGRAAIDWGVYGVPETFIVEGDGTIAYKFIGPMTAQAVADTILPEIAKAGRPTQPLRKE